MRAVLLRLAAVGLVCAGLAACGESAKRPATQVAARVNGEELSVHQINFVLRRTPGLTPDRAKDASREVLERLIDQELAVQRARDAKLDREAEVMQRLEAARREVLAQAWLERIAGQVVKPTAAEVEAFFKANPALFAERRIWRLNEIVLPGRPQAWDQIQTELKPLRSAVEAAAALRKRGIDTAVSMDVARPSEAIPLEVLPAFAKLGTGDVAIFQNGAQLVIAEIRSSQPAPVDAKQAGPAIEQFMLNKRRAEAAQSEMKRLRDTAKLEYRGEFDGGGSPAPTRAEPKSTGGSDKAVIEKGISGLK